MAQRRQRTQRLLRFLVLGAVVGTSGTGIGAPRLPAGLNREPSPVRASTDASAASSSSSTSSVPSSSSSSRSSSSASSPTTSTTRVATTTTTAAPETTSGRVVVAGDSLTFTALWNQQRGGDEPPDLEVAAWMGWTAAHVRPEVEAAVAEGEVDTLVVALGTNDSGVGVGLDGWSPADVELFRQLIALPGPEACVVIVLPGSGAGIDPAHAVEMDEARLDLISMAEQRGEVEGGGPTVVVDWQATIDAHPELMAEDGIHFAVDPATNQAFPAAASARTTLYWQGVDACTT